MYVLTCISFSETYIVIDFFLFSPRCDADVGHVVTTRCVGAQMLRDQLKERHEQHERGLKEDLELRHKSSKASLLRRRQMRRRSVSQSPSSSRAGENASEGGTSSSFDPSPLRLPASVLPPATGAVEGTETAGPDLTKYRNMKTVSGGAGCTMAIFFCTAVP